MLQENIVHIVCIAQQMIGYFLNTAYKVNQINVFPKTQTLNVFNEVTKTNAPLHQSKLRQGYVSS